MKLVRSIAYDPRLFVLACAIAIPILLGACDSDFNPFNPPVGGDDPTNPFNPLPDTNPLTVQAGPTVQTTEEETVTLTATASGGMPPYFYRWNIDQVPDDPEDPFDGGIQPLANNTSESVETAPFQVGEYQYRIMVTDSLGRIAEDRVVVAVAEEPLRAIIEEAPEDDEPLIVEAATAFTLTADSNFDVDLEYTWNVEEGEGVEILSPDSRVTDMIVAEPGEALISLFIRETGDDARAGSAVLTIIAEQGDSFLVRIDSPPLLMLEEAGTLTANLTNDAIDPDSLTYEWEIIKEGRGELTTPDLRTTELIGDALETITVRVTAFGEVDGEPYETSEEAAVVILGEDQPRFRMTVISANEGVNGQIVFEFNAAATPKTVANIVRYIDDRFYNGVIWHRIATANDEPFVAQFGGFKSVGDELQRQDVRDPVESENEFTIGNTVGTVGVALFAGDPNSGTSQLFVNMIDNSFLDDQSFTAFATVVEGFEIIEAMFDAELDDAEIEDGGSIGDVPVDSITIASFSREETTPRDDDDETTSGFGDLGNVSEDDRESDSFK